MKNKWYQSNAGVIALLILFFPVGIYLMWKHTNWSTKTRGIITACVLVLAILISSTSGSQTKTETTKEQAPTQSSEVTKTEATPTSKCPSYTKTINYSVVSDKSNGTLTTNSQVVIGKEDATQENITELAKQLCLRFTNDAVRIGIFTDRSAAKVQADFKTGDLVGDELKAYNSSYVGQYNRHSEGHTVIFMPSSESQVQIEIK